MMADQKQITRLLKTARGQLDGILNMVEEDRYCVDISNQLLATQSILAKANTAILQAHISHCVAAAAASGDEKEKQEKLEELNTLLAKLMK